MTHVRLVAELGVALVRALSASVGSERFIKQMMLQETIPATPRRGGSQQRRAQTMPYKLVCYDVIR